MNISQRDVFLLDRTLSNLTDFYKKRLVQKWRRVQMWDRWAIRLVVVTYIAINLAASSRVISMDGQDKIFSLLLFIVAIVGLSRYFGRRLDYYDRLLDEQPKLKTLYELARIWMQTAPDYDSGYVLELCDALEKQDIEKSESMIWVLEHFHPALADTQPIKFILEASRF